MSSESRVFEAHYGGFCICCERRFEAGDLVHYSVDGDVIHGDCHVIPERYEPPAKACPACFTVPAKNGRCGCDD